MKNAQEANRLVFCPFTCSRSFMAILWLEIYSCVKGLNETDRDLSADVHRNHLLGHLEGIKAAEVEVAKL